MHDTVTRSAAKGHSVTRPARGTQAHTKRNHKFSFTTESFQAKPTPQTLVYLNIVPPHTHKITHQFPNRVLISQLSHTASHIYKPFSSRGTQTNSPSPTFTQTTIIHTSVPLPYSGSRYNVPLFPCSNVPSVF